MKSPSRSSGAASAGVAARAGSYASKPATGPSTARRNEHAGTASRIASATGSNAAEVTSALAPRSATIWAASSAVRYLLTAVRYMPERSAAQ